MSVTAFGIIVLPLALLFLGKPERLLQMAILFAVFDAAAALILGEGRSGFGLSPALVPMLIFVGYIGLQYMLGMRYPGEATVLPVLTPLMMLMVWAAFSGQTMPRLFEGQLMVWPNRPDIITPDFVPLSYTSGNVTQTMYLALNTFIAVVTALFMSRARIPYAKLLNTFLMGGYLVVVISFWQLASRVSGVFFPEDFLWSNPSWAIVEQALDTVPRIQGPFTEPAALAFYLTGLSFCCLWLSMHGYKAMRPDILFGFAVVTVVLSTSTTGIVCTVVGIPIVLLLGLAGGVRGAVPQLMRTMMVLGACALVLLVPLLILRPELLDSLQIIIDSTLSKQESDSFQERTTLDAVALEAMLETLGLGAGWGSYRASSLIPGLLANGGIPALVLVIWQALAIRRMMRRAENTGPHHGRILLQGFAAAVSGQLAAALVSGPTITGSVFYLQIGAMVGTAARMMIDHKAAMRAMAAARRAAATAEAEAPAPAPEPPRPALPAGRRRRPLALQA